MVKTFDAAELRKMSLPNLVMLAQELGLDLAGLEDRASAIYTRLMSNASAVETIEA